MTVVTPHVPTSQLSFYVSIMFSLCFSIPFLFRRLLVYSVFAVITYSWPQARAVYFVALDLEVEIAQSCLTGAPWTVACWKYSSSWDFLGSYWNGVFISFSENLPIQDRTQSPIDDLPSHCRGPVTIVTLTVTHVK